MGRIKIVEIIADSSLSGAPLHLLTLVKRIDKSQFSVTLICPEGWLAQEAEKLGIKTIKIAFKGFADYSSISKLKKQINRLDPQIIHLHGIRAGWLGIMAAKEFKDRIIYTEHLYTQSYHLESRFREWFQLKGLSYILKSVRIILTPSQAVKKFLIKKFKIGKNKIIVVYNGLEDVHSSWPEASNSNIVRTKPLRRGEVRTIDGLRIGFIGSLNQQKGVETLLEAFKIVNRYHPKVKLEIIGSGPLKGELVKKAGQNVFFLGAKKDIFKYLANWNMLILPSISESFGQAAVEAAIMAKPVVATNVGGLPEVVKDYKTGLLVKANNSKSLAQAINYLLEHENEAKKIGERARLRYEKLFTAAKMVKKIEKIYVKI